MNNREIAIDVFKHPLIQEILKRKLADSSVINRLIIEEIMLDEADDSKKQKSIAEITSAIATALDGVSLFLAASGYGMSAVPFIEAIGGAAGLTSAISYFLQGEPHRATEELIAIIPFAKIPVVNKMILKLLGPISKIGIKLQPENASRIASKITQEILKRVVDRSKAVPQEAKQALVKYIPRAEVVPWEAVETAIAKTTSLTKPQGETHEQDFESQAEFFSDGEIIIQTALGLLQNKNFAPFWKATKDYNLQGRLSAVRLEVMVAIFLAFLVSKKSTNVEEVLNPETLADATGGQLTAQNISDAFQMASDGFKKAEEAGKPWVKVDHFNRFVKSQAFADAWIASMKLFKNSKEPVATTDEPTDDAQQMTTTTGTQLPVLAINQDVEKEKEENLQITQQATSPESIKSDFDKSEEQVPELRYDDYIKKLDEFFGMGDDPDVPSFMKVFFLRDQVDLLYKNLVPSLSNIIDPSRSADEEDKESSALKEEETAVFQDKKGDTTVKSGQALKDYRLGRSGAKMLQKGIIKTKDAAGAAAKWVDQLFSPKEESKDIPIPTKQKRFLKRELAALADILVQTKKISTAYKKYGTSSSSDPQFDGTSLKKYLNALLDKVQTHTANIVYLLAELIRKAESTANAGSSNLQEQEELSREQKIKEIRKAFDEMGFKYKHDLKTSLEAERSSENMKKAQASASEILEIAKRIIPFFPHGIVHSQTGKVISLDDATKALDARIKEFKLILRDLLLVSKEDVVAEAHIGEMYESLKETCKAISDNFDVPCKIRKADIKILKTAVGDPVQGLTGQPQSAKPAKEKTNQPEPVKQTKPQSQQQQQTQLARTQQNNTDLQRVQEKLKPIINQIIRGQNG